MRELSPDEITNLLNKPTRTRGSKANVEYQVPGTNRTIRRKVDFTDRSLSTWFKLVHRSGTMCECGRRNYLAEVILQDETKTEMCRYCFLEGKGLLESAF